MRFIPVVLILINFSCEDDTDYRESFSPVIGITELDTVSINENITIHVIQEGSSGCSSYSRHLITGNDSILDIEFYQKRPEEKTCPNELIEIETAIEVSFNKPGRRF